MKILIGNDNFNAHYYIRVGLAKAFNACGHQTHIWNINEKPVFDVFDEFEPDIFIFQTYNLNKDVIQIIKERPHLKCIMKAADWDLIGKIDPLIYPVLQASQEEIDNVMDLFEETGLPNYLYIHYHPDYIEETHAGWIKKGLRVESQLSGADIFEAHGRNIPNLRSEVVFIGGYWPYKAQTLDKYLIPICNKHNVKIFGNSQWPVPQYCGYIDNDTANDILSSSIICPNLSEPHSQVFGYDVIERPFKLLANSCFVISDYVEGLSKLFDNDEIVFAHTPEEFHKLVSHYVKYPNERIPYTIRGFQRVIKEHTYFHRVSQIFERLGYEDESQKCLEVYQHILKQMGLTK